MPAGVLKVEMPSVTCITVQHYVDRLLAMYHNLAYCIHCFAEEQRTLLTVLSYFSMSSLLTMRRMCTHMYTTETLFMVGYSLWVMHQP